MTRFVVEQDGLGFIDAVKALAREAGLELSETSLARAQAVAAAGLHEVMAAAVTHCTALLRGNGGSAAPRVSRPARDERGAAINDVGLGFAPDSLLETATNAILIGWRTIPSLRRCSGVRGAHPSLRAETVSAQIIEALTWAPDLDRLDLAVGLQKVGFHDTARAILAKCWSTSLPS